MSRLNINDARSEALFASSLQRSDDPTAAQVLDAIGKAMRTLGTRGCAERMAQAFGDHPDAAVIRMRWARQIVADVFAPSAAWHGRPDVSTVAQIRLVPLGGFAHVSVLAGHAA
jgi:hypothetical protein